MLADIRLVRLLLTTCIIGMLSYLYLDTLLVMRWTPSAALIEEDAAPSNEPEPEAQFNVLDYVNGPPTQMVSGARCGS